MAKIKIYTNVEKLNILNRDVEVVVEGANVLIEVYHAHQEWDRIECLETFERILKDPVKEFDNVIVENCGYDRQQAGKAKPNPEKVAELFDIDRAGFVAIITGKKVLPGCASCGKLSAKTIGKAIISYPFYSHYRDLLQFDPTTARFAINEEAVEQKKAEADVYIDSDSKAGKRYQEWVEIETMLNKRLLTIPLENIAEYSENILQFSYGTNKVHLNPGVLAAELSLIKD